MQEIKRNITTQEKELLQQFINEINQLGDENLTKLSGALQIYVDSEEGLSQNAMEPLVTTFTLLARSDSILRNREGTENLLVLSAQLAEKFTMKVMNWASIASGSSSDERSL